MFVYFKLFYQYAIYNQIMVSITVQIFQIVSSINTIVPGT